MSALPSKYAWLADEPGPQILREALACYGVAEFKGDANNPVIIEWAKEVGGWIGQWYEEDAVPWCGLAMAVWAKRAKFPFNQKALAAREWVNWGQPAKMPMLGDVLIFGREGGGHVGLYVGEDHEAYHVLGGNQADAVNITRILKSRLIEARRCKWRVYQPASVRRIILSASGQLSTNEA
jgi:uncharacterized protein (TIGR02594 family)